MATWMASGSPLVIGQFHGLDISDQAFGFAGASGSFAFADPVSQVGYAYGRNKIDIYGPGDPREKAVRRAFSRCLERQNQG